MALTAFNLVAILIVTYLMVADGAASFAGEYILCSAAADAVVVTAVVQQQH